MYRSVIACLTTSLEENSSMFEFKSKAKLNVVVVALSN